MWTHEYTYPVNFADTYLDDYPDEDLNADVPGKIQCLPAPGPFLPCQDLFDWWTLRCGVWIVFLCAMLGNGTVVFVLIFSRSKMDVPRFLVCNLAAADFCMGLYLGKQRTGVRNCSKIVCEQWVRSECAQVWPDLNSSKKM